MILRSMMRVMISGIIIKVAPRYGTNQDIAELFEEVHKREMHIILDLVPGHTSIEHPWFRISASSMKNEYTDRYIWTPCRKVKPKFDQPGENNYNIRGFIIGFGGGRVAVQSTSIPRSRH